MILSGNRRRSRCGSHLPSWAGDDSNAKSVLTFSEVRGPASVPMNERGMVVESQSARWTKGGVGFSGTLPFGYRQTAPALFSLLDRPSRGRADGTRLEGYPPRAGKPRSRELRS
jgi:hypothetical protein